MQNAKGYRAIFQRLKSAIQNGKIFCESILSYGGFRDLDDYDLVYKKYVDDIADGLIVSYSMLEISGLYTIDWANGIITDKYGDVMPDGGTWLYNYGELPRNITCWYNDGTITSIIPLNVYKQGGSMIIDADGLSNVTVFIG